MGGSNSSLMVSDELLAKDLSGQVFIITGGNSGIGKSTVEQLAKQGGTVILACRRLAAGEEVAEKINAEYKRNNVTAMALDLASLDSVRAFAKDFKAKHDKLNCLVNNAGVMNVPKEQKTKEGYDMQFGTNHLGHFLLVNLLTDTLKASAPSRVVCMSSCYHIKAQRGYKGHIDFDDLHFDKKKYEGWSSYAQSKLANVLHAKELARRLEGTGVTAVSLHPGFVRSNLINHTMSPWMQFLFNPILKGVGMIEPWEGVQTSLQAILLDDANVLNGGYYSQTASPKGVVGGWPMESPLEEANDPEVAKKLWEVSEELVRARE